MSAEPFPSRAEIVRRQIEQLRAMLSALVPANRFYTSKLQAAGVTSDFGSEDDFPGLIPFTTKAEIVADQAAHPPCGTNLTFPIERYTRCHQTSGTTSRRLVWLDTPQSWDWMLGNWAIVLGAADITAVDRIFFAFSFGPFLGFWTAFEAALKLGCYCLPGGGMNTITRLRAILDHGATVLCCTPTYAIHLAETAATERIDLSASRVRKIIVAGEPGGSVPALRERISTLWQDARVYDHHGMTEVGPVTFECPVRPGVLHVIESSYIPEVIDPKTGVAVRAGETGELVLTNLGRVGSPLIRYRTGDLVRASAASVCRCGRSDLALEGGISGRVDDMVVVRGVNVYPSAVEEIIHEIGGIAEYRVEVNTASTLTELAIAIEPDAGTEDAAVLARRLEDMLQAALNLRVPVKIASPGTLPRFELKARRWVPVTGCSGP